MSIDFGEINRINDKYRLEKEKQDKSLVVSSINGATSLNNNARLTNNKSNNNDSSDNEFENIFEKAKEPYIQGKK